MGPVTSVEDAGTADGIYTTEQAMRGQRVASMRCFPCHTPAEWGSPGFMDLASRGGVGEVYGIIRSTMPPGNPGGLRNDQYASLLAYMLRIRGVPPGETQLPNDPEELQRMLRLAGAGALGVGSHDGPNTRIP